MRAAGFGYGGRFEHLKPKSISPSPGTYNTTGEYNKANMHKAYSFGLAREHFKKVYIKENPVLDISVPGPGMYNPRPQSGMRSSSKYSLRPRTA